MSGTHSRIALVTGGGSGIGGGHRWGRPGWLRRGWAGAWWVPAGTVEQESDSESGANYRAIVQSKVVGSSGEHNPTG